ncbi:hypothetical protein ACVU7I_01995 [Patulibacter sp. S7RM1-6]
MEDESRTGTPTDYEGADLHRTTEEGPAQPSSEAEDRNKSPRGGRAFNDDEVAVDPDDAPSANSFMVQITLAMFVVVILLVLAAVTGSGILTAVALVSILPGLGVVLRAIFAMMSTD